MIQFQTPAVDVLNVLWREARRPQVRDHIAALRADLFAGKEPMPEDLWAVSRYIGQRTQQNRFGK